MKNNIKGGKQMPRKSGLSLPNVKISLALSVLYIAFTLTTIPETQVYVAEKNEMFASTTKSTPNIPSDKKVIAQKIAEAFPSNSVTMVAIAMEESGLNPNAINYNCRYKIGGSTYDKITHVYIDTSKIVKEKTKGYVSTWCRKGHEKYAWSVDGSLFQINGVSKLSIEESILKAQEKYNTQGLNAWVAYSTGRYKKHLPEAKKLLGA